MKNIFSKKHFTDTFFKAKEETFTLKTIPTGESVFHGDTPDSDAVRVNAGELEAELKAVLEGEVRFDNGSRALYATDASNYRQVPVGVIIPKNKEDVIKAV